VYAVFGICCLIGNIHVFGVFTPAEHCDDHQQAANINDADLQPCRPVGNCVLPRSHHDCAVLAE
jgi:hypothetical protein